MKKRSGLEPGVGNWKLGWLYRYGTLDKMGSSVDNILISVYFAHAKKEKEKIDERLRSISSLTNGTQERDVKRIWMNSYKKHRLYFLLI